MGDLRSGRWNDRETIPQHVGDGSTTGQATRTERGSVRTIFIHFPIAQYGSFGVDLPRWPRARFGHLG